MKRVYVAGAYSDSNVIGVLNNMGRGMYHSLQVALDGYAPFCPWLDYHFILMQCGNNKLTIDWFYKYSIAWLSVSDAVLVIPQWENSKGTINEIKIATELKIPVFYSLAELESAMPVAGENK